MKIELVKYNQPDGSFWYGIEVDGSCQIPAYGDDISKAKEAYDKMIEFQKSSKNLPKFEIIQSETV
jgi:hypothetical protein